MEYLTNIVESNSFPLLSAFVLGIMTSIGPCPLATNITAIGYISKDIESKNKIFLNGIIYTLGRTFSYTLLAVIIFYGADQFSISSFFQQYGEKMIGPFLILIGLFMFDVLKISFPGLSSLKQKIGNKGASNYWDVFLLGVVFALAFCPYSGVLYFGMLIPMTITSGNAIVQPIVYAVATGIPVIIFAWLIAFTLSSVGKYYNQIKIFEFWLRRVIAAIFIVVGSYYIYIIYL